MSNDITIPPMALEAAASAICEADFNLPHDAPDFHVYARAACIAMLRAWPGMKLNPSWELRTHKRSVEIILPITENTNV